MTISASALFHSVCLGMYIVMALILMRLIQMFNACNVSMHPMHATLTLQSGCLMLDDIVCVSCLGKSGQCIADGE